MIFLLNLREFRGFQRKYAWNIGFSEFGCQLSIFPSFMKSKKNLTRFTYENAAFEGWRLCISRAGSNFTKYFPDKKFGGGRKSLEAAERALAEIKVIIQSGRKVNGKLSPATIRKCTALLSKV